MNRFKVGDTAYYQRENEPEGYEGYCIIEEIMEGIHTKVRWEGSEQWNVVETRYLKTKEEAEREGLG